MLFRLLVIYGGYFLSSWLQNYWMIGIAQDTVHRMRSELFCQFQMLPISFFDKRKHGELMSRVTNDMENVSSTLNSSVIQYFFKCSHISWNSWRYAHVKPVINIIYSCDCATYVLWDEVDYRSDREIV